MDHAAIAKKIRTAIFDAAEANGRVMSGSQTEELIEGILRSEVPAAIQVGTIAGYGGGGGMSGPVVVGGGGGGWYSVVTVCADQQRHPVQEEWR